MFSIYRLSKINTVTLFGDYGIVLLIIGLFILIRSRPTAVVAVSTNTIEPGYYLNVKPNSVRCGLYGGKWTRDIYGSCCAGCKDCSLIGIPNCKQSINYGKLPNYCPQLCNKNFTSVLCVNMGCVPK